MSSQISRFHSVLSMILPKINLLERNWVIQVSSLPVFGYSITFSWVAHWVGLQSAMVLIDAAEPGMWAPARTRFLLHY